MFKKNNPGCTSTSCSCGPPLDPDCYFLIDTFTRADDADPGADWEELGGASYAIAGGTITGDGKILAVPPNPAGEAMHVSLLVKGTGTFSILLAADDTATSFIRATIVFGEDGSLSVDSVGVDGDGESVAANIAEDAWILFTACYNGTTARASAGAYSVAANLPGVTGDRAGFDANETVQVDNFYAAQVSEECAVCETLDEVIDVTGCVFCADGEVAEYYQVEISGVDEHTDCSDCGSIDGVYIIGPMEQKFSEGEPLNCAASLEVDTKCDGDTDPGCYGLLTLQFYQASGQYRVLLNFQTGATDCGQGGGQPAIEWEEELGASAPDCLFLDEEGVAQEITLPWISDGIPTTERCTGAASTVTIRAIPAP